MKIIYIILFSSFIFSANKHLDANFYDTSINSDKIKQLESRFFLPKDSNYRKILDLEFDILSD